MIQANQATKQLFEDPALGILILSNLITIFFAIEEHWNLSTMLWIYCFQSLIIGFFNFVRMLRLRNVSDSGIRPNWLIRLGRTFQAFFFVYHFEGFNLLYMHMLPQISFLAPLGAGIHGNEERYILVAVVTFFISHGYSYWNSRGNTYNPGTSTLMFYPYARIFPTHLVLLLGFFVGNALPLFLLLKMVADVTMHQWEQKTLSPQKTPSSV